MNATVDNNAGGKIQGVIISLAVHVALLLLLLFFTLQYSVKKEEKPKQEFIAVELKPAPMPKPKVSGETPIVAKKDFGKPVETAPPTVKLSNKTRTPKANNKPDAKPATAGNTGDIERYEKNAPKINEKSLFQSNSKGTDDADERSKIKDNSLFKGSSHNNEPTRSANAQSGAMVQEKGVQLNLEGRNAVGGFPKPTYNQQKSGKIVVEVIVNEEGKVISAKATGKGSTLQDYDLRKAAEEAALRTRFNVDKTKVRQAGTITYIFTLK